MFAVSSGNYEIVGLLHKAIALADETCDVSESHRNTFALHIQTPNGKLFSLKCDENYFQIIV